MCEFHLLSVRYDLMAFFALLFSMRSIFQPKAAKTTRQKHAFEVNHQDNENLMKYKIDKNVLDLGFSVVFLFFSFLRSRSRFILHSHCLLVALFLDGIGNDGDAGMRECILPAAGRNEISSFRLAATLKREPQQTMPSKGERASERGRERESEKGRKKWQ